MGKKLATEADYAALDWEPWKHSPDEWKPPTEEEWRGLLITLRVAWHTLYKTKDECIEVVRKLEAVPVEDDPDGHLMGDMARSMMAAEECFKTCLTVLGASSARMISAATTYHAPRPRKRKTAA